MRAGSSAARPGGARALPPWATPLARPLAARPRRDGPWALEGGPRSVSSSTREARSCCAPTSAADCCADCAGIASPGPSGHSRRPASLPSSGRRASQLSSRSACVRPVVERGTGASSWARATRRARRTSAVCWPGRGGARRCLTRPRPWLAPRGSSCAEPMTWASTTWTCSPRTSCSLPPRATPLRECCSSTWTAACGACPLGRACPSATSRASSAGSPVAGREVPSAVASAPHSCGPMSLTPRGAALSRAPCGGAYALAAGSRSWAAASSACLGCAGSESASPAATARAAVEEPTLRRRLLCASLGAPGAGRTGGPGRAARRPSRWSRAARSRPGARIPRP